jgi:RHS repeat-associated protein
VASSLLWTVKERNQDDALRVAQGGDWTTTFGYDEQSGKLEAIDVFDEAAKSSVLHLTYERDPNGFVERRTELVEGRDEVFHMDGHHRLKEWLLDYGKGGAGAGTQASIYSYDSIDNLEKVSVSGSAVAKYEELFTHGGGKPHALYNRTKPADPQTFFYDAGGRLVDGDARQYTYTSFDLPRSVTTPAGTTQFTYDASGSRVRKQGPSGMTTSIAGLYESHEGAGGFTYTFVVHSSDGPVAEIIYKPSEPNPRTVHYRHHDALGSVSVTTAQGGSESRRYYEPFGAHVGFDGSPTAAQVHDVRHGFTGHAHDDDLGLIDMRGRLFDPSTRQFLTPDPLGRLGASPYSYVRNNPLNWIDPSGFTEEDPEGGWFTGLFGGLGTMPLLAGGPFAGGKITAAVAAMDFPNGNDAPDSSGCPTGTGTAPMPCAMPGEAGCLPSSGPPTPEEPYARYTTPIQLHLSHPATPGTTAGRSPELEEAEEEYDALLAELRASAAADAAMDEVREIRTDPAKRTAFAEALWVPFYEKYQIAKLRLGADLLVQGSLVM